MKTYTTKNQLMAAGVALAVAAGTQAASAALLVDVDLTGLGAESSSVSSIANGGTLGGTFDLVGTTTAGVVTTAGGVQGLNFATTKYNSSVNSPLTGNASYSATAWVYNPEIASEEAIVAWGSRGQGNGANSGLHQGTNNNGGAGFGAVGHWGGDYDVEWGNDGQDILFSEGNWVHLAWSYDSSTLTESIYINGALSNTKTMPAGGLNVYGPVPFALGSEHSASGGVTDPDSTAVLFSGIIGSMKVWDEIQDQSSIQSDFALGIPEPSGAAMTMLGLLSFVGLRRRK